MATTTDVALVAPIEEENLAPEAPEEEPSKKPEAGMDTTTKATLVVPQEDDKPTLMADMEEEEEEEEAVLNKVEAARVEEAPSKVVVGGRVEKEEEDVILEEKGGAFESLEAEVGGTKVGKGGNGSMDLEEAKDDVKGEISGIPEAKKGDCGEESTKQDSELSIYVVAPVSAPVLAVESKSENKGLGEEDASLASLDVPKGEEKGELQGGQQEEIGVVMEMMVDDVEYVVSTKEKMEHEGEKDTEVVSVGVDDCEFDEEKEGKVFVGSIEAIEQEDKIDLIAKAKGELGEEKEASDDTVDMGGEEALEELTNKDVDVEDEKTKPEPIIDVDPMVVHDGSVKEVVPTSSDSVLVYSPKNELNVEGQTITNKEGKDVGVKEPTKLENVAGVVQDDVDKHTKVKNIAIMVEDVDVMKSIEVKNIDVVVQCVGVEKPTEVENVVVVVDDADVEKPTEEENVDTMIEDIGVAKLIEVENVAAVVEGVDVEKEIEVEIVAAANFDGILSQELTLKSSKKENDVGEAKSDVGILDPSNDVIIKVEIHDADGFGNKADEDDDDGAKSDMSPAQVIILENIVGMKPTKVDAIAIPIEYSVEKHIEVKNVVALVEGVDVEMPMEIENIDIAVEDICIKKPIGVENISDIKKLIKDKNVDDMVEDMGIEKPTEVENVVVDVEKPMEDENIYVMVEDIGVDNPTEVQNIGTVIEGANVQNPTNIEGVDVENVATVIEGVDVENVVDGIIEVVVHDADRVGNEADKGNDGVNFDMTLVQVSILKTKDATKQNMKKLVEGPSSGSEKEGDEGRYDNKDVEELEEDANNRNLVVVEDENNYDRGKPSEKDREVIVSGMVPTFTQVPVLESNMDSRELGEEDAYLASPDALEGEDKGELWNEQEEKVGVVGGIKVVDIIPYDIESTMVVEEKPKLEIGKCEKVGFEGMDDCELDKKKVSEVFAWSIETVEQDDQVPFITEASGETEANDYTMDVEADESLEESIENEAYVEDEVTKLELANEASLMIVNDGSMENVGTVQVDTMLMDNPMEEQNDKGQTTVGEEVEDAYLASPDALEGEEKGELWDEQQDKVGVVGGIKVVDIIPDDTESTVVEEEKPELEIEKCEKVGFEGMDGCELDKEKVPEVFAWSIETIEQEDQVAFITEASGEKEANDYTMDVGADESREESIENEAYVEDEVTKLELANKASLMIVNEGSMEKVGTAQVDTMLMDNPMEQSDKCQTTVDEEVEDALASPDALEGEEKCELWDEQQEKIGVVVGIKVVDIIPDDIESIVVEEEKFELEIEKCEKVGFEGIDGCELDKEKVSEVFVWGIETVEQEDQVPFITEASGEKEVSDYIMDVGADESLEESIENETYVENEVTKLELANDTSLMIVSDGSMEKVGTTQVDTMLMDNPMKQNDKGQTTIGEAVEDVTVEKPINVENVVVVVEDHVEKHTMAENVVVVLEGVDAERLAKVENIDVAAEVIDVEKPIEIENVVVIGEGDDVKKLTEDKNVDVVVEDIGVEKAIEDLNIVVALESVDIEKLTKFESVATAGSDGILSQELTPKSSKCNNGVEETECAIKGTDHEEKDHDVAILKTIVDEPDGVGNEDRKVEEAGEDAKDGSLGVAEAKKDDGSGDLAAQDMEVAFSVMTPKIVIAVELKTKNRELGEEDASLAFPNAPEGEVKGELQEKVGLLVETEAVDMVVDDEESAMAKEKKLSPKCEKGNEVGCGGVDGYGFNEEVSIESIEATEPKDKVAHFAEVSDELGDEKVERDDTVDVEGKEDIEESKDKDVEVEDEAIMHKPVNEASPMVVNDESLEQVATASTNIVLEDSLEKEQNAECQTTAGLGSLVSSMGPTTPCQLARFDLFSPSELAVNADSSEEMTQEEKRLHNEVELIQEKFLRLVYRLGSTPKETVVAQVMYRLSLVGGSRYGRQSNRAFSHVKAWKKVVLLEEEGKEDLDFSCNILVLGKSGVGKSATVNSIFGEAKSKTDAFSSATTSVQAFVGDVDGVKIRIIDTPGLRPNIMDQGVNRKILVAIQKYTKKFPPDVVVYVDRLDYLSYDLNDLPLLKTITSVLGSSIWFNTIVSLTHAASTPPEGFSGAPMTYEVLVAQRSHIVQQSIRQAVEDMSLMNPIALVQNHPSCMRDREGQKVLANGQSWRHQMLLLCYSSKILSKANSLLMLQDPNLGKLVGHYFRSLPLPFLLSSLLQSRDHPKLSTEQGGNECDSNIELDSYSDVEQDDGEKQYDQIPPFNPLAKAQLGMLAKEHKIACFDEYNYRDKLHWKKQWKNEMKKWENFDQGPLIENVSVPLPDMVIPSLFDCDSHTYRYCFLESNSNILAKPILDAHGWDHDYGYDGVSMGETLAILNRFPTNVGVQITKDKKEFRIHLDSSIAAKHGENASSLARFNIQNIGQHLAYILHGETKIKNIKKNKIIGGFLVTILDDIVATGLKVEDQLSLGKWFSLVASTGAIGAQGDTAYGANFEARLKDNYPTGQHVSTLGLSLMKWCQDLALGANLQSQFSIGRGSKMDLRIGINNKLSGQITARTSTSEHVQIVLLGLVPVVASICKRFWPSESSFT